MPTLIEKRFLNGSKIGRLTFSVQLFNRTRELQYDYYKCFPSTRNIKTFFFFERISQLALESRNDNINLILKLAYRL